MNKIISVIILLFFFGCAPANKETVDQPIENQSEAPFLWANASVYFLLTDRFNNGDPANDFSFDRKQDGATLRSFSGGDIRGISDKIKDGYFNNLGINAIWITPPVEQIHGFTDEGTGKTYGYHGYWAKDWTNIDPNYGTLEDLQEMVELAHDHGIRVLLDVVVNHTGPVTPTDIQWPDTWVRTDPVCEHADYVTSVGCALVENLPDIKTESDEPVNLPEFLAEKWKKEGRYEKEMDELDAFFSRTGYPRAPRFYIIKWLTDYVRLLGVDGFRVDTAKHTEASVWEELYTEAQKAFSDWKTNNPDRKLDDNDFYMVGEVYGYGIQGGLFYDYGDTLVNFFDKGLQGMINFSFKSDAGKNPESIFNEYASLLNTKLKGKVVMNYISSHDDSGPYDLNREKPFESATKLLLAPGSAQIYYGDELARTLTAEGTQGDAHLRSEMNWEEFKNNKSKGDYTVKEVFDHWSKLCLFRKAHPSVGAGMHEMISESPYIFKRTLNTSDYSDMVMVIMDELNGEIDVSSTFDDDLTIKDYYTGKLYTVKNGKINIATGNSLILLGS